MKRKHLKWLILILCGLVFSTIALGIANHKKDNADPIALSQALHGPNPNADIELDPRLKKCNLIIFMPDAAGASHVSCYGYDRDTTPEIDKMAAEGVLFENAFSQASYTLASVGSLFTGVYPETHTALSSQDILPDSQTTIAEMLQEAGFRTAAFSTGPIIAEIFNFDQGFEEFLDYYPPRNSAEESSVIEEVVEALKVWPEVLAEDFFEQIDPWVEI